MSENPNPEPHPEKQRVQFDFSDLHKARLDRLVRQKAPTTMAAVLKKALEVYEFVADLPEDGTVVIYRRDGSVQFRIPVRVLR